MNRNHIITMNRVSFAYERGRNVLENIDFAVTPGESVGIVGANGAGKSSLLKLIVGLNRGFAGEILVKGMSCTKKNLPAIRKTTGYIFQDTESQLFLSKVYDDIAFGPRNYGYREEMVEEMVKRAMGLTGCEHLIDKSVYKLSGGEKKQVAIASILAMEPEILLMDEPSASLDPGNRRKLIRLIPTLPGTKLITSHDLDMIWEICERTILLDKGRIIADGPTKEVLNDEILLEEHGLELPLMARIQI